MGACFIVPVIARLAFCSPTALLAFCSPIAWLAFQNTGIGYKQAFFKAIYPFFFLLFTKNKPFGYIGKKLCSIPRKMQFCGYISHFFLKYTQSSKVYLFLPVFVKYGMAVPYASLVCSFDHYGNFYLVNKKFKRKNVLRCLPVLLFIFNCVMAFIIWNYQ